MRWALWLSLFVMMAPVWGQTSGGLMPLSYLFGPEDHQESGIPHVHSCYSDGTKTILEIAQLAKAIGVRYVIMTDHLDCLDLNQAEFDQYVLGSGLSQFYRAVQAAPKQFGVANYISDCREATVATGVLMVPGAEITMGGPNNRVFDPAGGRNADNVVHMLAFGPINNWLVQELKKYLGTGYPGTPPKTLRMDDAQDQVARMLHASNLAVGIAHPYLDDLRKPFHYTVYKNRLQNVDCIEYYNNGFGDAVFAPDDQKSMEAMGFVGRTPDQGPFVSLVPVAGADYHGLAGAFELSRLYRWTTIGLPKPLTTRRENFEVECATIAMAFHADCQVPAWSVSEQYRGQGELTADARVWQGNQYFGTMGRLNTNGMSDTMPLYVVVPGSIARITPGHLVGNMNYAQREPKPDHFSRFIATNVLMGTRARAPIGSPQLAGFLRGEMVPSVGGSSGHRKVTSPSATPPVGGVAPLERPPGFRNYAPNGIDGGLVIDRGYIK